MDELQEVSRGQHVCFGDKQVAFASSGVSGADESTAAASEKWSEMAKQA